MFWISLYFLNKKLNTNNKLLSSQRQLRSSPQMKVKRKYFFSKIYFINKVSNSIFLLENCFLTVKNMPFNTRSSSTISHKILYMIHSKETTKWYCTSFSKKMYVFTPTACILFQSLLSGTVGQCIRYESHIDVEWKNYWNKYTFGHIKVVCEV